MELNEITEKIIGCAIRVHKALGPGLLESTYEVCLAHELSKAGLDFATQVGLPVIYHEVKLDAGYRIDMLVEGRVIVEQSDRPAIADTRSTDHFLFETKREEGRPVDQLQSNVVEGRNQETCKLKPSVTSVSSVVNPK